MADKIFADGFSFKRRDNAPDFVVGNLSCKVDEAITFLKNNSKNGWVNMNVMTAKTGKNYVELDTFVPKSSGSNGSSAPVTNSVADDLPF